MKWIIIAARCARGARRDRGAHRLAACRQSHRASVEQTVTGATRRRLADDHRRRRISVVARRREASRSGCRIVTAGRCGSRRDDRERSRWRPNAWSRRACWSRASRIRDCRLAARGPTRSRPSPAAAADASPRTARSTIRFFDSWRVSSSATRARFAATWRRCRSGSHNSRRS